MRSWLPEKSPLSERTYSPMLEGSGVGLCWDLFEVWVNDADVDLSDISASMKTLRQLGRSVSSDARWIAGRVTSAYSIAGRRDSILNGAGCCGWSENSCFTVGDRGDDAAVDVIEPDSVQDPCDEFEIVGERSEKSTRADEGGFQSSFVIALLVLRIGCGSKERKGNPKALVSTIRARVGESTCTMPETFLFLISISCGTMKMVMSTTMMLVRHGGPSRLSLSLSERMTMVKKKSA
jgi:hypothetical protein